MEVTTFRTSRVISNKKGTEMKKDEATKRQRARNKALASRTKPDQLPSWESRGLGRKLKPSGTFPNVQCSHVPKRPGKKDDFPTWQPMRCVKSADLTKEVQSRFGGFTRRAFCLEHEGLYK